MLGVLYDEGYFSAIINITLDGVEAANIAPLDAPDYVGQVVVAVDPGPRFEFGRAELGPLAPGTAPIEAYAVGEPAGTGVIKRATSRAISDWREASHAKARVAGDEIIADHNVSQLESRVDLNPGPAVTFGRLHATGNERLLTRRLLKIAGYPEGENFHRQAGRHAQAPAPLGCVFRDHAGRGEAAQPRQLDGCGADRRGQKPRRIGAAFEISSIDGAQVSAYWLRNLLRGGERFRIEAGVGDISADADEKDYSFGIRIDRPATLSPDTTGYINLQFSEDNEPDYYERKAEFAIGFNHIESERLSGTSR